MSRFRLLADSDSEHSVNGDKEARKLTDSERSALRERRNDELEAIQAIYGDDVSVHNDDEDGGV